VPNGVGVSLARNRRSPKRPSEPRPSGVHPEEDVVKKVLLPLAVRVGGGDYLEFITCLRYVTVYCHKTSLLCESDFDLLKVGSVGMCDNCSRLDDSRTSGPGL
jgi:hypothetical protein